MRPRFRTRARSASIAEKEFWDRIRNRWVLAMAAVFALFALAIAYLGAAQQGAVGFRGIDATIASLVSLVIYLVPLIALLLGYDADRRRARQGLARPAAVDADDAPRAAARKVRGARRRRSPFLRWRDSGWQASCCRYKIGLTALYQYAAFSLSASLLGLGVLEHRRAGIGRWRPTGCARAGSPSRCLVLLCAGLRPAVAGSAGGDRRQVDAGVFSGAADAQPGRHLPHP